MHCFIIDNYENIARDSEVAMKLRTKAWSELNVAQNKTNTNKETL